MDARQNKGRPGSTRYAQGASRPATTPGADVRALRYSRSHRVSLSAVATVPDPEPLDDVYDQRVDDIRLGPCQGSDLPMIGHVFAALSATPASTPVRPD